MTPLALRLAGPDLLCYTVTMDDVIEPGADNASADGEGPAFVYIVRCADGTLYTGWSTDVARRIKEHNAGRGARYTRQRVPVALAYCEQQPNRSAAMKREEQIKRRGRAYKERLVSAFATG